MAKTQKPADLQGIFSPPIAAPKAALTNTATEAQTTNRVASRIGKRGKLVYLTEAAEKQLTHIGTEQDKTQQALMVEAVNLLFEHYGRDQIA
ncbi:MAG: ribbon-helix-helix domain-containing protein [Methylococcaceae bacterium]